VLVRWVGLGWVCKLVGRVGMDEEKVTHVTILSESKKRTLFRILVSRQK